MSRAALRALQSFPTGISATASSIIVVIPARMAALSISDASASAPTRGLIRRSVPAIRRSRRARDSRCHCSVRNRPAIDRLAGRKTQTRDTADRRRDRLRSAHACFCNRRTARGPTAGQRRHASVDRSRKPSTPRSSRRGTAAAAVSVWSVVSTRCPVKRRMDGDIRRLGCRGFRRP